MPWLLLLAAGLLEIVWAVGLKYTEGFTRLTPSLITIGAMIVSMTLLGLAMRSLPLGTAYAVWTGIGIAGTAVFGIVMFGESAAVARVVCIVMILAGIIGLKVMTPG